MVYRLSLLLTLFLMFFSFKGNYSYAQTSLETSNRVNLIESKDELYAQQSSANSNENSNVTFSGGKISLPWWMFLGFFLIGLMILFLIWLILPTKEVEKEELNLPNAGKSSSNQSLAPVIVNEPEANISLPIQTPTRLGNIDIIKELIDELQTADSKQRRKAIWELARKADSRAIKPLLDSMLDASSYDRTLILEALSEICSKTVRPMNHALLISLQDENPQVRKNAIRDLTKLYDLIGQIRPLLYHALDDSDAEVREVAQWAINQLTPNQIPLEPPLGNNQGEVNNSDFQSSDSLNL